MPIKDPERRREYNRVYARAWRAANPEKKREQNIKRYGLKLSDFSAMYSAQDGKCAICREEKELVVDHDHETGKVRGLLCGSCNTGLGRFGDSVVLLLYAAGYLNNTK